MKISKTYRSNDERSILTGMIMSSKVLGRIHAYLNNDREPFRSKWTNTVAGWCLSYFAKYNEAPREAIQSAFSRYAQKSKDEENVQLVERFLIGLSKDYEAKGVNEDFLLDKAGEYFNQVRIEKLLADVESEVENKDITSAINLIGSHTPVDFTSDAMIDVYSDDDLLKEVLFEEDSEVLIRYPGPLGDFFGRHLERDGFVAFMAPEKRGKSFWLIDMAWRASVSNRRRTLFYSVGDMSKKQMMRRILTRAARQPIKGGEVIWPRKIKVLSDGKVKRLTRTRQFDPLSLKDAKAAMEKVRIATATKKSLLKMRCTSNGSTNVANIRSDIDMLIAKGWVPEVVVIDYADIMAPEPGGKEDYRHQINKTWMALRRLSQDYHVLVITATQSDAASYEAHTLGRKHFAEDKRKIGHVTAMLGINQTEEEKERGIFRINYLALREGAYLESKYVTVAGSLKLASPAICSAWSTKDS